MPIGNFNCADLKRPRTTHNACLNGHTGHHGQIRVYRGVRLFSEILTDELPNARDPCRPSDQDDLIHLLLVQMPLDEDGLDGSQDLLEEVRIELLKGLPGQLFLKQHFLLLRSVGSCRLEVQRDSEVNLRLLGEVEFGSLYSLSEEMDVFFKSRRNAVLLPDSLCGVLEQTLGEVLPSKLIITYGDQDCVLIMGPNCFYACQLNVSEIASATKTSNLKTY